MKDYYKILGVKKNASGEEIRARWIKLVQKHHPDQRIEGEVDDDRVKEINEAYEVLKHSSSRVEYDLKRTYHRRKRKSYLRRFALPLGIVVLVLVLATIYLRRPQEKSLEKSEQAVEPVAVAQNPQNPQSPQSPSSEAMEKGPTGTNRNGPEGDKGAHKEAHKVAREEAHKAAPGVTPKAEKVAAQDIPASGSVGPVKVKKRVSRKAGKEMTVVSPPPKESERPERIVFKEIDKTVTEPLAPVSVAKEEPKPEERPKPPAAADSERPAKIEKTAPKEISKVAPSEIPQVALKASPQVVLEASHVKPENPPPSQSRDQKGPEAQRRTGIADAKTASVEVVQRHDSPGEPAVARAPFAGEEEVRLFFAAYIDRYIRKDLDGFLSFFSFRAVQNRKEGFEEIRKIYTNFFNVSHRLLYHLTDMRIEVRQDAVEVKGRYEVDQTVTKKRERKIWRGPIRWTLIKENGVLRILSVDFHNEESPS